MAPVERTEPQADSGKVTFSFGGNWRSFLSHASATAFTAAREDISDWLGPDGVAEKRVLDIGSGSGIHSLAFLNLKAAEVVSFDYDPKSVAATRELWEQAGRPAHWIVSHGSILDRGFLGRIAGPEWFDIVYAWGVLHHTGAMWEALDNASALVKRNGQLMVALYEKTPRYADELALKKKYNAASALGKKIMVAREIAQLVRIRFSRFARALARGEFASLENPFAWNQKKLRGMDTYHDLVDWLGGLPYEVASVDEVTVFLEHRGYRMKRVQPGGCNVFLFDKVG